MYNLWYFVAFYTVLLQFLAFYAVLSQNRFLRLTRYCVEKNLAKNSARGEKMTYMRYARTRSAVFTTNLHTPHHFSEDNLLEPGQFMGKTIHRGNFFRFSGWATSIAYL